MHKATMWILEISIWMFAMGMVMNWLADVACAVGDLWMDWAGRRGRIAQTRRIPWTLVIGWAGVLMIGAMGGFGMAVAVCFYVQICKALGLT